MIPATIGPAPTSAELAEVMERIGTAIEQLPGVSRRNPHRFAEAKSELAHDVRRIAAEMRVARPASDLVAAAAAFRPGRRVIAGRQVAVDVRRAAHPPSRSAPVAAR